MAEKGQKSECAYSSQKRKQTLCVMQGLFPRQPRAHGGLSDVGIPSGPAMTPRFYRAQSLRASAHPELSLENGDLYRGTGKRHEKADQLFHENHPLKFKVSPF